MFLIKTRNRNNKIKNVVKFYSLIFANSVSCVSRMRLKIQLTHKFMYYTNIIYICDYDDGLEREESENKNNITVQNENENEQ